MTTRATSFLLRFGNESVPGKLLRLLDLFRRNGKLDIGGNPWAEPPESIVHQAPEVIERYFEDLFADPCRVQRNSVKVILVGQEGAGKTRWVTTLPLVATTC